MNPDKVMEDPVDIGALLEPFFLFGIGSGFSAIGCTAVPGTTSQQHTR
jgi:hypothetical protein